MASLAPDVRLSMRSLRIIWIAVFVAHAVIGFLLYRWRALFHGFPPSLAGSDWIVFGIPFWLAFAAYWLAFTFSPYLRPRSIYRYAGLTVLSLAGAFFCFLFYMFFAVNTYGTQHAMPSNQSMKPTAPLRNEFSVFATTPCRGLSPSRQMSFPHRTLWLFVSAVVGWLVLCLLSFIHSASSSPVDYWRATYQPWSRIGLDIDIWSRMYLLIFVVFAIPACYSGRLPAVLWKRALVGGILFSCGGIAWALFYFGVLGAIRSRPQGMEFDVWFWGLIMRRLLSFSVFFFPIGAVAFSFLPPRRVATKTSNQSLEPTAGRRDAHI